MAFPWTEQVTLGIVHFMVYPQVMRGDGPIVETAEELMRDGFFEVIEVGPVNDSAERERLRVSMARCGAGIAFAAQPILLTGKLDLNSLDPGTRARAVDAMKAAITQARELEATGFAVLSGPDPGARDRGKATDALIESLVDICRTAADLAVHLEVFDYDIDKRCLVGPTAAAVELAGRVRAQVPNFGLMLDLSHLPLQRESSREALTAARSVLTHVHVGNCVIRDSAHPQYGDQHPRFGIAGGENGVPELVEFLNELFKIGYLKRGVKRMVSIEVKPGPGESGEELVAQTKRTWESAWAQVNIPG